MRMVVIKFTLLSVVLFLFFNVSFTQNHCNDYHLKKCEVSGDKKFKYSGQSRSIFLEAGQISDFKFVCYKGFEYRVSICNDMNLKGLFFMICEDSPMRNILFDSSKDDSQYLEKIFYVEKSKNLIIEVKVPESDAPKNDDQFGCVGILFEYARNEGSGFSDVY